jgi:hypothetical protein
MGNGALPHGPSYRAHPRLYLGVFHCGAQNFDAIGGTADIDWPPAPIASEAYDPKRPLPNFADSRGLEGLSD